jgi:predicted lipid-binding transport protein (Tim44 family)
VNNSLHLSIIKKVVSMKSAYQTITIICLFLITATSYAENIQNVAPPATPPKESGMKHEMGGGMGMGMHHGMGGMMAGMTEEQKDKHMRAMQDHMLKMHDLSTQIVAEKDAAKKEVLKKQQLELMKAHHAEMMESHHPMKEKSPMK